MQIETRMTFPTRLSLRTVLDMYASEGMTIVYLKKTKIGMLGVLQPLQVRHKHSTTVKINILKNKMEKVM